MSSATVETRPRQETPAGWLWRHFREFRRTRPFWGGLLAMVAGVPILYFPYAHLTFGGLTIAMSTTAGAGSLIIGVLMIILGLTAWFQPAVRFFAGIATILLTLVSIPVSNLAGFGLALLPGLVGGGLMVSWAPLPEPATAPAKGHRAARRGKSAGTAVAESVATEPAAAEAEPEAPAVSEVAEAPTAELPAQAAPKESPAPAASERSAAEASVPRQGTAGEQEEAK
ncbi:DUF6114 domain-containing protein [Kitasatospora sp. NPDC089797]|uniref:DUF6114 domain-containing protein n=1 Tax=Kitasatospora sp. NPDC089797 TaxID=3155298 RepID=UPI00344AD54A